MEHCGMLRLDLQGMSVWCMIDSTPPTWDSVLTASLFLQSPALLLVSPYSTLAAALQLSLHGPISQSFPDQFCMPTPKGLLHKAGTITLQTRVGPF